MNNKINKFSVVGFILFLATILTGLLGICFSYVYSLHFGLGVASIASVVIALVQIHSTKDKGKLLSILTILFVVLILIFMRLLRNAVLCGVI